MSVLSVYIILNYIHFIVIISKLLTSFYALTNCINEFRMGSRFTSSFALLAYISCCPSTYNFTSTIFCPDTVIVLDRDIFSIYWI